MPHQIARGASVVAVRIWPAKDYTRLTIESDGELKVKQTANSDPSRLTVYIEGIDLLARCASWWASSKPTTPTSRACR